MRAKKTLSWRVVVALGVLTACSDGTVGQNDASTGGDAGQDGGAVTCTTPGAACPGGGSCFFPVGDCTATMGICSDDSACAGASTETVCHCDGTQTPVPQCGPGNYALAKVASFGPCPADAGTDAATDAATDAGTD